MALKIRRGTDPQRSGVTFDQGEIVWTTDAQQLWVGDGVTQGGIPAVGPQVIGYGLSFNNTTKRVEVAGLSTDDISESPTANNKFFTQPLAQDAAALLFTTGIHTGISVQYDDTQGRINLTVDVDDIGITDVVNDTTPQLGGNLDLNNSDITGTGDISITGSVTTSGTITNNILSLTGNKILSNSTESVGTIHSAAKIKFGETSQPNTLWLTSDKLFTVGIGITDGNNTSGMSSRISRGTLAAPAPLVDGDFCAYFEGLGYDGTNYVQVGAFGLAVEGPVTTGNVKGFFGVLLPTDTTPQIMTFTNNGSLSAPIIQTGVYESTPSDTRPASPAKGMIIFNDSTSTFEGWNGTAWAPLG